MAFELGVYSFGNTPLGPDATTGRTGQAIRDLIEAIQLAEAVGLDFFGIGEHHTLNMPVSIELLGTQVLPMVRDALA